MVSLTVPGKPGMLIGKLSGFEEAAKERLPGVFGVI